MSRNHQQSRRDFLKTTAAAAAAASGVTLPGISAAESNPAVAIFPDPDDKLVAEPPVQWSIEQLRDAFSSRGITAQVVFRQNQASGKERIIIGSRASALARERLVRQKITVPDFPEALALVRSKGQTELLACGSDVRGLVYAVLELADRVRLSQNPLKDLRAIDTVVQRPANKIRSIARPFNSDVEDKTWFYDRSFWQAYLTELATQRFNRFSLTFGIGYDFTTDITDAYFHFAYPFLLAVPGYDVRAVPLADSERDKNLEMVQFIGDETVKRGLQFHLGLWTHAYKWTNSPHANYLIEGLNPDNHVNYCRDALTMLLKAVPTINGVTLRIHGESGIAEGSYDFWKTLFDAVPRCGRRVEIDLHAKGIDQQMIDNALATGMPVTVAPKFWAEHMGLGYMQGAIRPLEMPPREENDKGSLAKATALADFCAMGTEICWLKIAVMEFFIGSGRGHSDSCSGAIRNWQRNTVARRASATVLEWNGSNRSRSKAAKGRACRADALPMRMNLFDPNTILRSSSTVIASGAATFMIRIANQMNPSGCFATNLAPPRRTSKKASARPPKFFP